MRPPRLPRDGRTADPRTGGGYSHFQGGSVYWSPAAGAHAVRAGIRSVWAASGWENGRLGFPKSGEYGIAGGVAQDFQFGRIVWTPSSGTAVEPRAPFANCTDARNAGAAPIYRGQYGYADNLDRDQDGVACEV
ncbi:excalibur calcium-binding domain-containing protein [Blastococcus sp. SYSU DS0539]